MYRRMSLTWGYHCCIALKSAKSSRPRAGGGSRREGLRLGTETPASNVQRTRVDRAGYRIGRPPM